MSPYLRTYLAVILSVFILSSCSSSPKKNDAVTGAMNSVELKAPIELKLKGDHERKELNMFVSRSRTENVQGNQKPEESIEETKFATEQVSEQLKNGFVALRISTVDKDGKLDLSQIAMPEFGKILNLVLAPNGQVARAGNERKNSIFYVSPISLPSTPVQVGDTWATTETWISQNDGTPMVMETASILRGVVACGNDQCADIEMSGDVNVQGGLPNVMFKSHWTGRLLFAINAGTVLWSRTDSLETLTAENVRTTVQSCLEGLLVKPEPMRVAHLPLPKCDPAGIPAQARP